MMYRLHLMRTLLYPHISTWKPNLPVCTVLGLEQGKECIIVGTLYKHIIILDEYSNERSAASPQNFVHSDDDDYLILEDESGRVKLRGTLLLPSADVTGLVVALHGKETGAGYFMVEDVLQAGQLPPQIDRPLNPNGEDKYVVFVSGLSVGSSSANPLRFQHFIDHITRHLGDEKEQGIAAKIVQVVVAGNSVEFPRGLFNGQNLGSKDQSKLSEATKELDILLTQIASGIPLDIMPGASDPANFSLPQLPLHNGSASYNTFRSCTNLHSFELDNVRFLGTSGQNLDNLAIYSDPFFVEACPHVYFIGNQDKYETSLIKESENQVVRLVSIPRFAETETAVAMNLKNLECHALRFGTQLD